MAGTVVTACRSAWAWFQQRDSEEEDGTGGARRCETMDLQVKDKRISWICKAQGFIELHNANPDLYNDAVSQTTTSSVAIFFVCFICIPVLCIGEDWDTI